MRTKNAHKKHIHLHIHTEVCAEIHTQTKIQNTVYNNNKAAGAQQCTAVHSSVHSTHIIGEQTYMHAKSSTNMRVTTSTNKHHVPKNTNAHRAHALVYESHTRLQYFIVVAYLIGT